VAGRRVIAFASQSPYVALDLSSGSSDEERHDIQGQRAAVLSNFVSAVTGEDGVARFSGLTVIGTTSPFVYIAFYCEGEYCAKLNWTWVVGRGSWVVGRGSWVVGRGSWVVGRGSWVVGSSD
jgi:hypothetical protein